MGNVSGDRGTQIFVSPQEFKARQEYQPNAKLPATYSPSLQRQTHRKLHKNKEDEELHVGSLGRNNAAQLEATIPLHKMSPWTKYKKIITLLDLAGEVIVSRKKSSLEMVGVKSVDKGKENETLQWLRKLQHPNTVTALEAFSTESVLYVVYEEMHLPLENIVRSTAFPSSKEIGTIMGQIVDGLICLESLERIHGSLSCDNVLLHRTGLVKLARYDTSVQASSQNKRRDLKGLATITLRLMQKYVLEDGSIGVDKQEYWRQSQILEFLSSTKSADGPGELRKHPFLEQLWQRSSRWPIEVLSDLITVADCTVPRYYRWEQ